MTVIDCVTSPPAAAMRAAGVTGVCRYLSWADQRDTLGKVIHQAEFDGLRGERFDVLLNWEYDAQDWLGGASAGAAHAAEAVRQARALGYPAGCAIPGSADFNMTAAQWNGPGWLYAGAYSAGIRSAGYVAGVYGPWDVLTWCRNLGGFGMFWQSMSTSWSGGRNAQLWPGAHLWQRRSGFVGGLDVDFNDVIQTDYGQAGDDMMSAQAESILAALANGGKTYIGDDGQPHEMVPTTEIYRQIAFRAAMEALPPAAAPTQDQVNAAVAKVMNDPAWLTSLGAAVASHIHVS